MRDAWSRRATCSRCSAASIIPTRGCCLKSLPSIDTQRRAQLSTIEGVVPDLRSWPRAAASIRAARSPTTSAASRRPRSRPSRRAARGLLAHRPPREARRAMSEPLLKVTGLKVHFPIRRGVFRRPTGAVKAVDGVSFAIHAGRDLRAGRRERLRQVDHRLCDARHRPPDLRTGRFSRRGPRAGSTAPRCATRNATCRSSSRIRIRRSIRR